MNQRAERHMTRPIHIGTVPIGGGAPVSVQSMTNTDTRDVAERWREYIGDVGEGEIRPGWRRTPFLRLPEPGRGHESSKMEHPVSEQIQMQL